MTANWGKPAGTAPSGAQSISEEPEMSISDAEAMRSSITSAIGRDSVYITARDEARHFDPLSLTAIYAGQLLFGFVRSASGWLWETLKKKGAEKGEEAIGNAIGDALGAALKKVEHAVSPEAAAEASTEGQKQVQQIDLASQALKELGAAIEPSYIESFLSAGEAAAAQQLMRDNFPEAKARRIAAAVTLQVELSLKGAQPA
jgi:hypothetical protein